MKSKGLNTFVKVLLVFLVILLFFEIFNDLIKAILLFAGLFFTFVPQKISKNNSTFIIAIGIMMLVVSLFSTISAWILAIILFVFLLGENQPLLNTVRESLFETSKNLKENEFVTVKFKDEVKEKVNKKRTTWLGGERKDSDIYEWEDINYTKLAGTTVMDLGNTIVPKGENIIMIRKGFGDVKILVPDEVAVSLNLNVFIGKIKIGEDKLTVNNETIQWRSKRFDDTSRQIKIVSSVLLGKIEVIFI